MSINLEWPQEFKDELTKLSDKTIEDLYCVVYTELWRRRVFPQNQANVTGRAIAELNQDSDEKGGNPQDQQ